MDKFKTEDLRKSFPQLENEIIEYWKKNQIFEKSVENRPEDNIFSFYDGPPFITGLPHYGSLLPSIAKDLIPRYQTMKGKRVRRVWGWDCHGLPAENKVENKLGIKSKREIEEYGIDKFIEECKLYVQEVSEEWNWYIDHIGRWVDFEHGYKTMDLNYMESVLWVFKEIYDKGLIYKGTRTSLFCPRCSTPISNFEIAMDNSYKEMEDPTVTVKFKLKEENTYILAWTTTPWTLPANLALAVNPKEEYCEVEVKSEKYIVASKLVNTIFEKPKILRAFKGKGLIGKEYQPLYSFFKTGKKDYKIYGGNFVTMDDGTGIVHIAPGFGEDDNELGKKEGLSLIVHVDDEGKLTDQVTPWKGLFFKKANDPIIKDLENRHLLFNKNTIVHSYPVCWRCETPLLYRVQEAWYLNVTKIKKDMLKLNENINWIPNHIKEGRFKKGLESAPDWCISRSRYWGTPIPIWECEKCNEIKVVGSVEEIEKLSGKKITDLHKPEIDEVTFKCEKCNGTMHRIKEVLDCWFESGSMPFAQIHYPFDNKEFFEKSYPTDYIVEYIAQVRGWFYTLHVISTALKDSNAFKNVVVTGVIMGSDGRKMSKLFKNYPDPKLTIENYGGEALRLLLMGSPLMVGEDFNINEPDISNQVKNVLLPLWNSYKYFITYANLFGVKNPSNRDSKNVLDKWILTKTKRLINDISTNLDNYLIPNSVKVIQPFIEDLSTWYIRRSRKRFAEGDQEALSTLYNVLLDFSLACAPIIPFITEKIYLNLTEGQGKESVHLEDYPKSEELTKEELDIEKKMELCREVANLGQSERVENKIKVRQPLQNVTLGNKFISLKDNEELIEIVAEELNVKEVIFKNTHTSIKLDLNLTKDLIEEGLFRELIRTIQDLRKKSNLKVNDLIDLKWFSDSEEIENLFIKREDEIKSSIKASSIEKTSDIEDKPFNINQIEVKLALRKHA